MGNLNEMTANQLSEYKDYIKILAIRTKIREHVQNNINHVVDQNVPDFMTTYVDPNNINIVY